MLGIKSESVATWSSLEIAVWIVVAIELGLLLLLLLWLEQAKFGKRESEKPITLEHDGDGDNKEETLVGFIHHESILPPQILAWNSSAMIKT